MENKLGSAVDIISSVSGLNKGSSSSIMSIAAPFATITVVKYVKKNIFDAMGWSKFSGAQSKHVASALPAEIGSLLGFSMANTSGMGDRVAAVKAQLITQGVAANKINSTVPTTADAANRRIESKLAK